MATLALHKQLGGGPMVIGISSIGDSVTVSSGAFIRYPMSILIKFTSSH